jgi:hypothetical protein
MGFFLWRALFDLSWDNQLYLLRRIRGLPQEEERSKFTSYSYKEFLNPDFFEEHWEELERGVKIIPPPTYLNQRMVFEVRRLEGILLIALAGQDISSLTDEVDNYLKGIDVPGDNIAFLNEGDKLHSQVPIEEAYGILDLNRLEFSMVIEDLSQGGNGDGFTQIGRIEKNVLENLFNVLIFEITYMLESMESTQLITSIFQGREAFVGQLIKLRDKYEQIYKEVTSQGGDIALFENGIARSIEDIRKELDTLKFSISMFKYSLRPRLYFRTFFRRYIWPRTVVTNDGSLVFRPPGPNPN